MDLGASPRAIICWGGGEGVDLLQRHRTEVYPEDIGIWRYVWATASGSGRMRRATG